jgi:hypothetical protein
MTNREFKVGERVYCFIHEAWGIINKNTYSPLKVSWDALVYSDLDGNGFYDNLSFDDKKFHNKRVYHADEVVEVDGVVKLIANVNYGDGVKITPVEQTPRPFRFGDKVNAFGVNGVVVVVDHPDVILCFEDQSIGRQDFRPDGRYRTWNKTPSLFHGWLED